MNLPVLQMWHDDWNAATVEALGMAGGFSGAKFWRVARSGQTFCLRRWPQEHPAPGKLQWIHEVLVHAARAGVEFLPVPLATRDGATFARSDGHLWELTPWMPGEADYHSEPSNAKLVAAMSALAEYHRSVQEFGGERRATASPGLELRRLRLVRLLERDAMTLHRRLDGFPRGDLLEAADEILPLAAQVAPVVLANIKQLVHQPVPQQPVIRDIWHDHVLFTGDRVTGIVDFGAMAIDTVATDLARLLGSLAVDDASRWEQGLAAYEAIRPLTANERELITAFDQANVVLSGVQWLKWIYLEEKQFPDIGAVVARLQTNLQRLKKLSYVGQGLP